MGFEALFHHLNRAEKISPDPVQFIDEGDFGYMVFIRLAPYGFRLRLYSLHGTEYANGTIQYPQGAFNLDRKIHMSGRIYNVNFRISPMAGGDGGSNRNASFLLIRHPIHHRLPVMDFTYFMGAPGIIQNTLGHRRFAGINVGDNVDVAYILDFCCFLFHRINSIFALIGICRSI